MVSVKTVLVTAATGHIGREVVFALGAHAGLRVLAGSRYVTAAAQQFADQPNVTAIEVDPDRDDTLARVLPEVDAVCQISPLSPAMGEQTRRLVALAEKAGVRHVVRFSLIGADDPAPITEGLWHREADEAVRRGSIPQTILQPTQYLQNFVSPANCASVRTNGALYLPLDGTAVANIDTRDLGRIAANILIAGPTAHLGKTYTLTGDKPVVMDEVAAAIGLAIGKPVQYVAITEAVSRQHMLAAGIPPSVVEAILGWFAYCRTGRAAEVVPDAARLLGGPSRTLRQFAHDYAHCFR